MSAEKIEPCPFCGDGDPQIDEVEMGVWAIVCPCGCTGPIEKFDQGAAQPPAKAIELWNRRPAKPS
jgi:hypothetical protein